MMVYICVRSELPCFRNSENVEMIQWLAVAGGYLGDSLHNAGERGEDVTDFPGMFEPVPVVLAVRVVAHHLGEAPLSLLLTNFRASIKSRVAFHRNLR
jgi:hypothetical protein